MSWQLSCNSCQPTSLPLPVSTLFLLLLLNPNLTLYLRLDLDFVTHFHFQSFNSTLNSVPISFPFSCFFFLLSSLFYFLFSFFVSIHLVYYPPSHSIAGVRAEKSEEGRRRERKMEQVFEPA